MNTLAILSTKFTLADREFLLKHIIDGHLTVHELVRYLNNSDARIAYNAAWVLSQLNDKAPGKISDSYCEIVKILCSPSVPNGVLRNLIRIFRTLPPLPVSEEGLLLNLCFQKVEDVRTPIAVRAFSFQILCRFLKKYPDLRQEIALLATTVLEEQGITPGLRHQALKSLKQVKK